MASGRPADHAKAGRVALLLRIDRQLVAALKAEAARQTLVRGKYVSLSDLANDLFLARLVADDATEEG